MLKTIPHRLTLALLGAGLSLAACQGGAQPEPPREAPAIASALSETSPAGEALTIGHRRTFKSAILKEARTLDVWSPPGHDPQGGDETLLYLTDGERHFPLAVALVQVLSARGYIPPMTVVGIHNPERARDLVPFPDAQIGDGARGGPFLASITGEMIPFVEGAGASTNTRFLEGWSLGGLFNLYAFTQARDRFDGFISISGALQVADSRILTALPETLKRSGDAYTTLYITRAEGDGPAGLEDFKTLEGLLKASAPEDLVWHYTLFEGEDHTTTVARSIQGGLIAMYPRLKVDPAFEIAARQGPEALRAWYQAGMAPLGPRAILPADDLNREGYRLLGLKLHDPAVAAFVLLTELYPDLPNSWDCLGEGLQAQGDLPGARAAYAKAVAMAEETGRDGANLPVFREHLEAVAE